VPAARFNRDADSVHPASGPRITSGTYSTAFAGGGLAVHWQRRPRPAASVHRGVSAHYVPDQHPSTGSG
jgi:hypothetical protein